MSKADPIFLIDVHPEYQQGLDFRRVKQLGYAAAFVKASQGGSYVPTGFKEYFARVKYSGLIPGLYHFLDATAPGVVQAQHFAKVIASVGGPEGKVLAVDFEHYGDASPSNADLSTFVAQLRRSIGNHPLVLYTAKSFWESGAPSGPFDHVRKWTPESRILPGVTGTLKPIPPGDASTAAPPNEDRTFFEHRGDHPFKHDAERFELVNAWWLAEASLLAYGDEDFVGARFREAGLPEVRYFHGESTQCYAAHNDDFVLAAFSGSDMREREGNSVFDALADWMVNLSFTTVSSGRGGRIHKGFAEALEEVWGPREEDGGLEAYLDGLCGEGHRRVWFTGHSLGGALATLAAGRYERAPEVYTFGAPRVGDEEYVEGLDTPVYRFVNGRDVVPKLPVRGPYRHPGIEKYIDDEGHIWNGKPGGDGLRAKGGRAVRRALSSGSSGGALRDHAPIQYAVQIWNAYVRG